MLIFSPTVLCAEMSKFVAYWMYVLPPPPAMKMVGPPALLITYELLPEQTHLAVVRSFSPPPRLPLISSVILVVLLQTQERSPSDSRHVSFQLVAQFR